MDTATSRLTRAAFRARVVYPGPVGRLVCRELLAWSAFGHRLGGEGIVMQVVDELLEPEAVGPADG